MLMMALMNSQVMWMRRLRVLRRLLVKYRAAGKIDKHLYHELYHLSKGNTFKHKRALVEHVRIAFTAEMTSWTGINASVSQDIIIYVLTGVCADPQGQSRGAARACPQGRDGRQARQDQGCARAETGAHCAEAEPVGGRGRDAGWRAVNAHQSRREMMMHSRVPRMSEQASACIAGGSRLTKGFLGVVLRFSTLSALCPCCETQMHIAFEASLMHGLELDVCCVTSILSRICLTLSTVNDNLF